jgi:hypothetical protein
MVTLAIAMIAVVALALCLFAAWRMPRRRLLCPSCGQASLRCGQRLLMTVMVDGRRAPDNCSYFVCDSCGGKFKQHSCAAFTIPTDAEWAFHCSDRT